MSRDRADGRTTPGAALTGTTTSRSPLGGAFDDVRRHPLPTLALLAVLGIAIAFAFSPVLESGWVGYDDDTYVTAQPRVQAWTADNVRWMFTQTSTFYWHPGAFLWHATMWSLGGDDAAFHHRAGLILHGFGSAAVFLLVLAMLGGMPKADGSGAQDRLLAAAAATLLWAVHPLRAEPVAWVAAQKELLSTLFMVLAATAWLGRGGSRDRVAYAASLVFLAAALLVKPMAMMLPAVLLVLDAVPLRRWTRWSDLPRLLIEKTPHFVLCVAAVLPSVLDPRQDNLLPGESNLGVRLTVALWGSAFPLVKSLLPSGLSTFYPVEDPARVGLHGRYLFGAVVLLAGSAWAIVTFRRGRPGPAAAWVAYLLLVLPVSGLRQAGAIETADRFAHAPSLALVVMLAWVLTMNPIQQAGALSTTVILVGLLFSATRVACAPWKDSRSLWYPVVERFPDASPVPHQNYGKWMLHEAFTKRDTALAQRAGQQLQRALALDPRDRAALNNLGLLRAWEGDRLEAERLFRASIEQDSTFLLPRANLAVLLAGMGRHDEARAAWRDALDTGGFMPPAIDASLRRTLGPPPTKEPR